MKTYKTVKKINDAPYIEGNPDRKTRARIAIFLPIDANLAEDEMLIAEFDSKQEAAFAADTHNKMIDILEK